MAKYKRFGKYLILDHLVDGGMAKICRASYLGEQANKIVAIKMVQPQYSQNPSFVQMFEDELKVTFGLVHPNIAQVYDYGLVDNQLYSAMEYVDGANLKQFLDRLKEKKFVFPVEISTHIISQVCQALHYAHTFTDKLTGKHFNIIHRDISPHNIMLTYDGAIKVIDFGIAKADSNSEATQAGTIKGKLSYLAPEYLDGLDLDHRYDQFAVGITLWEMLCSRKLFTAKNDLAVLKQIQACKIPKPSSINPNVPEELDQIVLRTLAKDRNQRFENLDKLNRSLVKFLYSNYPDFNATDLSYFAKQLFKEEILADRKKFVDFGKIDIKPYLDELQSEEGGQVSSQGAANTGHTMVNSGSFITDEQRSGKIELDLGSFDKQSTIQSLDLDYSEGTKTIKRSTGTKKRKKRTDRSGVHRVRKTSASSGKTTRTKVKSTPGKKSNKRAASSGGGSFMPILVAGCLAIFAVLKPDLVYKYTNYALPWYNAPGVSQNNGSSDPDRNPANSYGLVYFQGDFDYDLKVYVDGNSVKMTGSKLQVSLDKPHKLKIMKPGHKPWVYPEDILLTEGDSTLSISIPPFEKNNIGYLSTSNNYPPGSKIVYQVDGENVELELPLKNHRMPAGLYEFTIKNDLINSSKTYTFEIEKNKRNQLPK